MALGNVIVVAGAAHGAEWGDLRMRFVLDGDVSTARLLEINQDVQFCGKHDLVDERLVVNPANKGIANVIVWLIPPREVTLPVHDSYAANASGSVELDNRNCRFEPRIVALRTTQTLSIGNKDPIGHNANVTPSANIGRNLVIPAGGRVHYELPAEETLPVTVTCGSHTWMKAYLVVKRHPYVGISDKDGNLIIPNLPTGKWTFQLWQEEAGYVTQVEQDGKVVTWARGRPEIEIKPGGTDLKDLLIPLSVFKR